MMGQLYEQELGDTLELAYTQELDGRQELVCELELNGIQARDELELEHELEHDQC